MESTLGVEAKIAAIHAAETAMLAKAGVVANELRLCRFREWGVLVEVAPGGRARVFLSPPNAADEPHSGARLWLPRNADATPEGVAAVFSKWAREQRAAVRAAAAEAATGGGPCAAMGDPGAQPGGPGGGDDDERL